MFKNLIELTKVRIGFLVLTTTIIGFYLGSQGTINNLLLLYTGFKRISSKIQIALEKKLLLQSNCIDELIFAVSKMTFLSLANDLR